MGAVQSSKDDTRSYKEWGVSESGDKSNDDPTFPWLPLIEAVSETLSSGVVRRYSLKHVQNTVLSTSSIPLLTPDLIVNGSGTDRKCLRWSWHQHAWYNYKKELTPKLPSLLAFSRAMLCVDPSLRRLRFALVPQRINESAFWTLYFDRVYVFLRYQLLAQDAVELGSMAHQRSEFLDSRWERMLCLRNRLVRDVAYACCCSPLIIDEKGRPSVLEQDEKRNYIASRKYSSGSLWSPSIINACFTWLTTIDKSASELKKLKHWFASFGHNEQASPGSFLARCHLYAILNCPAFGIPGGPARADLCNEDGTLHPREDILVPLKGHEIVRTHRRCYSLVLTTSPKSKAIIQNRVDSSSSANAHTSTSSSKEVPSLSFKSPARKTTRKILQADASELSQVARLMKGGQTKELLFLAIKHGRLKSVRNIIEGEKRKKSDIVNTRDRDGATPLHRAVLECHIDIVRLLLSEGAKASLKMNVGKANLSVNIDSSDKMVSSWELSRGIDILEITFETWFIQCLMSHRISAVCDVLEAGRSPLEPLITGEIPIFWAVEHDDLPLVEMLVEKIQNDQAITSLRDSNRLSLLDASKIVLDNNKESRCMAFLAKYFETQPDPDGIEGISGTNTSEPVQLQQEIYLRKVMPSMRIVVGGDIRYTKRSTSLASFSLHSHEKQRSFDVVELFDSSAITNRTQEFLESNFDLKTQQFFREEDVQHHNQDAPKVAQDRSLVQGWLFHELMFSGEDQSQCSNPFLEKSDQGLNQWCGWWINASDLKLKSPLFLGRQGLAGPLYFLPDPIYFSSKGDLGLVMSPFRYTEQESGVTKAQVSSKAFEMKSCDVPGSCVRGTFCLTVGLEKAIELFVNGDRRQTPAIMVVELRFDQSLDAWLEASRGLVLHTDSAQENHVPC